MMDILERFDFCEERQIAVVATVTHEGDSATLMEYFDNAEDAVDYMNTIRLASFDTETGQIDSTEFRVFYEVSVLKLLEAAKKVGGKTTA